MNFPERYKADVVSAVESIDIDRVIDVIELFKETRAQGRNIFVCSNTSIGFSASKVVCDMMTRSSIDQQARFRILALHNGPLELDSKLDDMSAERVFVEQLKNFADAGDVAVGISATYNSSPIRRAFEYGKRIGCKIVALTGSDGGKLSALADFAIPVNSTHPGTVEDTHVIICHMIGSYFLEFDRPDSRVEGRKRSVA
jgi:D-sedoheptulose 7-phosphate isomerase